jgi:alpha-amylase
MPGICLYLQAHQPHRLAALTRFDRTSGYDYFDKLGNQSILKRVAEQCYTPAAERLEEIVRRYGSSFGISFSLSGSLIEQLSQHAPKTIEAFSSLFSYPTVEVLSETYYHSLASQKHTGEWLEQIALHGRTVAQLFGKQPTAFRDTELLYSDATADIIARMGYKAILTEGVPAQLNDRKRLYQPALSSKGDIPVLFRDFEKSDDIAFRFSDYLAKGQPLTARSFADRLDKDIPADGCIMLGMDVETFGEHQPLTSGILDFLDDLVALLLERGWQFQTPTKLAETKSNAKDIFRFSCPTAISWADTERDTSAWLGNPLQQRAFEAVWQLRPLVEALDEPGAWNVWRKLTASDHFYYMSTKSGSDGRVHQTFNAYESPYDAFIVYMNVLSDFSKRLTGKAANNALPL